MGGGGANSIKVEANSKYKIYFGDEIAMGARTSFESFLNQGAIFTFLNQCATAKVARL